METKHKILFQTEYTWMRYRFISLGIYHQRFWRTSIRFGSRYLEESWLIIPFVMIIFLDLPALLPVFLILSPIGFIAGLWIYLPIVMLISIFTITFQWFYVGKKISNFFWHEGVESEVLSINNEMGE